MSEMKVARAYHGTGGQAIEWMLHVNRDCDSANNMEFMKAWQEGAAQDEWPDFYEWLDKQPTPSPIGSDGDEAEARELLAAEYDRDGYKNVSYSIRADDEAYREEFSPALRSITAALSSRADLIRERDSFKAELAALRETQSFRNSLFASVEARALAAEQRLNQAVEFIEQVAERDDSLGDDARSLLSAIRGEAG